MKQLFTTRSKADLTGWLEEEGFTKVVFAGSESYLTTYWLGQPVTFKLIRREGAETFYKEAFGGSILVFEIVIQDHTVSYDSYCPILLFGLWNIKLSFKKNAAWLFKYRKEGYEVWERFEQYLKNT